MSDLHLCQAFQAVADDMVGHDLSPEDTARFSAHARQCSRCGAEWRGALARAAALATLTPWALEAAGVKPPIPGSTADAVFARLAAGEGLPSWRARWGRPLAVAAAVLLVAGGAWLATRNPRGTSSAAEESRLADGASTSVAEGDPEAGLLPLDEQRRILLESAVDHDLFLRRLRPQSVQNPSGIRGGKAGNATNVEFPGVVPTAPRPQRF